MNAFAPIATLMTSKLVTVNPEDTLEQVQELFDQHHIHHLPVVRFRKIVGIISKTDFLHFTGGLSHCEGDQVANEPRLQQTKAEAIMTTGMGKVAPDDRIAVALDIFSKNLFHALPVVENDELVGILTTQDIIRSLASERPIHPEEVYEAVERGDAYVPVQVESPR